MSYANRILPGITRLGGSLKAEGFGDGGGKPSPSFA